MTGVRPQVHKMGCREGRTSGERGAVGDGQGILEEAVGLLHRILRGVWGTCLGGNGGGGVGGEEKKGGEEPLSPLPAGAALLELL